MHFSELPNNSFCSFAKDFPTSSKRIQHLLFALVTYTDSFLYIFKHTHLCVRISIYDGRGYTSIPRILTINVIYTDVDGRVVYKWKPLQSKSGMMFPTK